MKTVKEEWEIFCKVAVPSNAGASQTNDMKMAFYGGAAVLVTFMIELVKRDNKPTQKEFNDEFDSLLAELNEFVAEKAGILN